MLLSKHVLIKLNGKKIKHYESLGYVLPKRKTRDGMRVPKNALLEVNIEDIPLGSHVDIDIICDYCGKEYSTRYDAYIKRKQNIINLDCCDVCKSIKNTELNLLRYGVENQFQREEVKLKTRNYFMEKYGTDHPMKVQSIKEKAMKNMSHNNGIVCSKQQRYLHQLFGGKLNYVDNSTKGFAIDIALVDKFIAIEFNGGGHNLQVQLGNITQDEFNQKEIVRYQILKHNGWKQIIITSLHDYLPIDNILIKELNKALKWFKSDEIGHSHYNINIGNIINDIKYGRLRKIVDKDLKEVI